MGRIYNAILNAIDQKMVASAATTLNEEKGKISAAVAVLVPMHLSALITKADDKRIEEIAKEAAKLKLFSKKAQIFEGKGVIEGVNIGERFENALIGYHNSDFPQAIAAEVGVKREAADRLSNWVAALVAGYLGQQADIKKTLEELATEKNEIYSALPSAIATMLGIKKTTDKGPNGNMETKACGSSDEHPVCSKKKKASWMWWVLLLILVVVLLVLWYGSYRTEKSLDKRYDKIEAQMTDDNGREKVVLPLGDGDQIIVYKGSFEDVMVKFLNSKEYKKATAEELRYKWFDLERIDFVYNSPDDMLPGSMEQIQNVAAILKHYPAVKIDIGGYADKRGSDKVNEEMSLERAEFVKWILVDLGVSKDRITTHGYSNRLAKAGADAPDAARAADRSIAIRFVK